MSGIGIVKSQRLADHFGSMDKLMNASLKELVECSGIGPKDAIAVRAHFDVQANWLEIEELLGRRINRTVPYSWVS